MSVADPAALVAPGIESFWPTFNLAGSILGLAVSIALTVTLFFLAIFQSESPLITTYSVPAASGAGMATGGGCTGGLDASTVGGTLVSIAARLVSSGGGWFSASV